MTTLSLSSSNQESGAVADFAGRAAGVVRKFLERNRALRELYSLTDHELADIGLSRSQVPDAVYGRSTVFNR